MTYLETQINYVKSPKGLGWVPSIMTCKNCPYDKLRSSSHKGEKQDLKYTTLTFAKQVQADLLIIRRMTWNTWSELEIVGRDAQFQQSRRVKWYYHNGVATVTDQNNTMSVFLSPNCLCGCLKGPRNHHKGKTQDQILSVNFFSFGTSCQNHVLTHVQWHVCLLLTSFSKVFRVKLRSTCKAD